jgi:hypothetical protein
MDDPLRDFFLKPSSACQRQYEALRAVFVDGRSQKEVAQAFGYTYDSLRQLVCSFRAACAEDSPPPFSLPRGEHAEQTRPAPAHRRNRKSQRKSPQSPTPDS